MCFGLVAAKSFTDMQHEWKLGTGAFFCKVVGNPPLKCAKGEVRVREVVGEKRGTELGSCSGTLFLGIRSKGIKSRTSVLGWRRPCQL